MDSEDKGVSLKDIGFEPRASALLPRPEERIPLPNPNGTESLFAQQAVQEAESIETSDQPHEKDAWRKSEALYNNIEEWIYRRFLTPDQGRKLLIAAMAKGEADGLKDPKTLLLNHSGFVERLAHQISRIKRTKEKLSMLYIDLEGFKNVNDTLGHNVGDEILKMTGAFIKDHIRGDDEAARLGGDEFAISGTEEQGNNESNSTNTSLKERLEEVFKNDYETFIKNNLQKRGLSSSVSIGARIGYAEYADGEGIEGFIKKADTDMNSKRDPNKLSR